MPQTELRVFSTQTSMVAEAPASLLCKVLLGIQRFRLENHTVLFVLLLRENQCHVSWNARQTCPLSFIWTNANSAEIPVSPSAGSWKSICQTKLLKSSASDLVAGCTVGANALGMLPLRWGAQAAGLTCPFLAPAVEGCPSLEVVTPLAPPYFRGHLGPASPGFVRQPCKRCFQILKWEVISLWTPGSGFILPHRKRT